MRKKSGDAAYKVIDLGALPTDLRAAILEDVAEGGRSYGVCVVEEAVNGAARNPIYGVYFGPDEETWTEAQAEFEAEIQAEIDEDAQREAAAADASKTAAVIEGQEDAAVAAIAGEAASPNKLKK